MIRAVALYTSRWGGFVLLKMDCVRVARGGSLSTLHRHVKYFGNIIICDAYFMHHHIETVKEETL